MHTFLMVLLWVVLGLLALLAVLLIVPAAVAVEYKQGEFTARLKLLGIFSFRLYPMKEKADRKKKKTLPRPESAPKEQPAKPEPKLHMTFEKVQGILSAAGAFMRRVFRALHFTGIIFILPIHRDDAAQTALARILAHQLPEGDMDKLMQDCLRQMRRLRLEKEYEKHRLLADEYERSADERFLSELMESQRIKNEIKKLYGNQNK